MRWLLLLVATLASTAAAPVKEDPQALAGRLVDTEQECERLKNLAAGKTEYSELLEACEASLLLDSYAYIDQNNVALNTDQDRFTVTTSKGEETVKKPPELSADELHDVLQKYEEKQALAEKSSSKRAQEIVNQQVQCELQESTGEDECTKKLNCLKDKFMADQNLNLNDNLQTFPITYKGKEVKIASPPDVDRSELCQSYSSATPQEEAAKTGDNDGDNEFSALDKLAGESPDYKAGGKKMVTKSLGGDNPLMDLALKAITSNGNSGGGGGDMTSKMMGMAAPYIGGLLTQNVMNKFAKNTPLAKLRPQDMNTLMKLASNGLKSKENRERVNRSDVKGAIEIVTKTAVHFAVLALQAHKKAAKEGEQPQPKKKGLAKFVEMLEMAMVDALAATAVNYVVDLLLPDDDDLSATLSPDTTDTTDTKPAKGGIMGALSSMAGGGAKGADAATTDSAGGFKGLAAQFMKAAMNQKKS